MRRDLVARTNVRVALLALAFSVLLLLVALVRVVRRDGVDADATTRVPMVTSLIAVPTPPPVDIANAVRRDPFAVDRQAPERTYLMPGESDEPAVVVEEPMHPLVLGTALIGEGRSFATCRLGDAAPVIVRVGDHVGAYTVKSITRGHVLFLSASGSRLDIPALTPGAP